MYVWVNEGKEGVCAWVNVGEEGYVWVNEGEEGEHAGE